MLLTVHRGGTPARPVLVAVGELDLASLNVLRRAVTRIPPGVEGVTLDLRPLRHIDSLGARLLIELDEESLARGGPLTVIVGRTGLVHQVIHLLGLHHILDVRLDDPDADRLATAVS